MPISAPRGIRNNNPCNLKDFGINWKGLSSPRSDADGFCVFSEPAYGIRACAMDLLKDFNKDAQRTILELMQEFAPGKDSNPTKQYADYIADNIRTRTGLMVGIETELDLNRFDVLYAFIEAVIKFENGQQPYSKATITRGFVLAGVEPPKPKH
ncbi:MAG: hypothetical protein MI750_01070, partial [Xanthomonadales bacterium]|nr:hypothetical protein [Xanthomonadales bacterium]